MLRISYEYLISNPQVCLRNIFEWFGFEADSSLLEAAIEYSSIETIQRLERRDGPLDPVLDRGVFVRDGSVGQWKQYFDSSDVRRVQNRLRQFGIKLDEFVLEA